MRDDFALCESSRDDFALCMRLSGAPRCAGRDAVRARAAEVGVDVNQDCNSVPALPVRIVEKGTASVPTIVRQELFGASLKTGQWFHEYNPDNERTQLIDLHSFAVISQRNSRRSMLKSISSSLLFFDYDPDDFDMKVGYNPTQHWWRLDQLLTNRQEVRIDDVLQKFGRSEDTELIWDKNDPSHDKMLQRIVDGQGNYGLYDRTLNFKSGSLTVDHLKRHAFENELFQCAILSKILRRSFVIYFDEPDEIVGGFQERPISNPVLITWETMRPPPSTRLDRPYEYELTSDLYHPIFLKVQGRHWEALIPQPLFTGKKLVTDFVWTEDLLKRLACTVEKKGKYVLPWQECDTGYTLGEFNSEKMRLSRPLGKNGWEIHLYVQKRDDIFDVIECVVKKDASSGVAEPVVRYSEPTSLLLGFGSLSLDDPFQLSPGVEADDLYVPRQPGTMVDDSRIGGVQQRSFYLALAQWITDVIPIQDAKQSNDDRVNDTLQKLYDIVAAVLDNDMNTLARQMPTVADDVPAPQQISQSAKDKILMLIRNDDQYKVWLRQKHTDAEEVSWDDFRTISRVQAAVNAGQSPQHGLSSDEGQRVFNANERKWGNTYLQDALTRAADIMLLSVVLQLKISIFPDKIDANCEPRPDLRLRHIEDVVAEYNMPGESRALAEFMVTKSDSWHSNYDYKYTKLLPEHIRLVLPFERDETDSDSEPTAEQSEPSSHRETAAATQLTTKQSKPSRPGKPRIRRSRKELAGLAPAPTGLSPMTNYAQQLKNLKDSWGSRFPKYAAGDKNRFRIMPFPDMIQEICNLLQEYYEDYNGGSKGWKPPAVMLVEFTKIREAYMRSRMEFEEYILQANPEFANVRKEFREAVDELTSMLEALLESKTSLVAIELPTLPQPSNQAQRNAEMAVQTALAETRSAHEELVNEAGQIYCQDDADVDKARKYGGDLEMLDITYGLARSQGRVYDEKKTQRVTGLLDAYNKKREALETALQKLQKMQGESSTTDSAVRPQIGAFNNQLEELNKYVKSKFLAASDNLMQGARRKTVGGKTVRLPISDDDHKGFKYMQLLKDVLRPFDSLSANTGDRRPSVQRVLLNMEKRGDSTWKDINKAINKRGHLLTDEEVDDVSATVFDEMLQHWNKDDLPPDFGVGIQLKVRQQFISNVYEKQVDQFYIDLLEYLKRIHPEEHPEEAPRRHPRRQSQALRRQPRAFPPPAKRPALPPPEEPSIPKKSDWEQFIDSKKESDQEDSPSAVRALEEQLAGDGESDDEDAMDTDALFGADALAPRNVVYGAEARPGGAAWQEASVSADAAEHSPSYSEDEESPTLGPTIPVYKQAFRTRWELLTKFAESQLKRRKLIQSLEKRFRESLSIDDSFGDPSDVLSGSRKRKETSPPSTKTDSRRPSKPVESKSMTGSRRPTKSAKSRSMTVTDMDSEVVTGLSAIGAPIGMMTPIDASVQAELEELKNKFNGLTKLQPYWREKDDPFAKRTVAVYNMLVTRLFSSAACQDPNLDQECQGRIETRDWRALRFRTLQNLPDVQETQVRNDSMMSIADAPVTNSETVQEMAAEHSRLMQRWRESLRGRLGKIVDGVMTYEAAGASDAATLPTLRIAPYAMVKDLKGFSLNLYLLKTFWPNPTGALYPGYEGIKREVNEILSAIVEYRANKAPITSERILELSSNLSKQFKQENKDRTLFLDALTYALRSFEYVDSRAWEDRVINPVDNGWITHVETTQTWKKDDVLWMADGSIVKVWNDQKENQPLVVSVLFNADGTYVGDEIEYDSEELGQKAVRTSVVDPSDLSLRAGALSSETPEGYEQLTLVHADEVTKRAKATFDKYMISLDGSQRNALYAFRKQVDWERWVRVQHKLRDNAADKCFAKDFLETLASLATDLQHMYDMASNVMRKRTELEAQDKPIYTILVQIKRVQEFVKSRQLLLARFWNSLLRLDALLKNVGEEEAERRGWKKPLASALKRVSKLLKGKTKFLEQHPYRLDKPLSEYSFAEESSERTSAWCTDFWPVRHPDTDNLEDDTDALLAMMESTTSIAEESGLCQAFDACMNGPGLAACDWHVPGDYPRPGDEKRLGDMLIAWCTKLKPLAGEAASSDASVALYKLLPQNLWEFQRLQFAKLIHAAFEYAKKTETALERWIQYWDDPLGNSKKAIPTKLNKVRDFRKTWLKTTIDDSMNVFNHNMWDDAVFWKDMNANVRIFRKMNKQAEDNVQDLSARIRPFELKDPFEDAIKAGENLQEARDKLVSIHRPATDVLNLRVTLVQDFTNLKTLLMEQLAAILAALNHTGTEGSTHALFESSYNDLSRSGPDGKKRFDATTVKEVTGVLNGKEWRAWRNNLRKQLESIRQKRTTKTFVNNIVKELGDFEARVSDAAQFIERVQNAHKKGQEDNRFLAARVDSAAHVESAQRVIATIRSILEASDVLRCSPTEAKPIKTHCWWRSGFSVLREEVLRVTAEEIGKVLDRSQKQSEPAWESLETEEDAAAKPVGHPLLDVFTLDASIRESRRMIDAAELAKLRETNAAFRTPVEAMAAWGEWALNDMAIRRQGPTAASVPDSLSDLRRFLYRGSVWCPTYTLRNSSVEFEDYLHKMYSRAGARIAPTVRVMTINGNDRMLVPTSNVYVPRNDPRRLRYARVLDATDDFVQIFVDPVTREEHPIRNNIPFVLDKRTREYVPMVATGFGDFTMPGYQSYGLVEGSNVPDELLALNAALEPSASAVAQNVHRIVNVLDHDVSGSDLQTTMQNELRQLFEEWQPVTDDWKSTGAPVNAILRSVRNGVAYAPVDADGNFMVVDDPPEATRESTADAMQVDAGAPASATGAPASATAAELELVRVWFFESHEDAARDDMLSKTMPAVEKVGLLTQTLLKQLCGYEDATGQQFVLIDGPEQYIPPANIRYCTAQQLQDAGILHVQQTPGTEPTFRVPECKRIEVGGEQLFKVYMISAKPSPYEDNMGVWDPINGRWRFIRIGGKHIYMAPQRLRTAPPLYGLFTPNASLNSVIDAYNVVVEPYDAAAVKQHAAEWNNPALNAHNWLNHATLNNNAHYSVVGQTHIEVGDKACVIYTPNRRHLHRPDGVDNIDQHMHATQPLARPMHDDDDFLCEWNLTNGVFVIWRRHERGSAAPLRGCGQWPTEQAYDLTTYSFLG